jgi:hypothetical protein
MTALSYTTFTTREGYNLAITIAMYKSIEKKTNFAEV